RKSHIKQCHELLEALRAETTINDTRDFGIGRHIKNLFRTAQIGFAADRRLLEPNAWSRLLYRRGSVSRHAKTSDRRGVQRAASLRFADPRVQALLQFCSCSFFWLPSPWPFVLRNCRRACCRVKKLPSFSAGQIAADIFGGTPGRPDLAQTHSAHG